MCSGGGRHFQHLTLGFSKTSKYSRHSAHGSSKKGEESPCLPDGVHIHTPCNPLEPTFSLNNCGLLVSGFFFFYHKLMENNPSSSQLMFL